MSLKNLRYPNYSRTFDGVDVRIVYTLDLGHLYVSDHIFTTYGKLVSISSVWYIGKSYDKAIKIERGKWGL